MKYWRPGLRVWWRSRTEAQVGLDPATILFGLTKADHDLLDALSSADPQVDCMSVARRLGWSETDFLAFARRLPAHALVDQPTADPNPVTRYWSVAETTGACASTKRFESKVIIDGLDLLGLRIADAVAVAGVHSLFLVDSGPVTLTDVRPGSFHSEDVGLTRALAATRRLRPRHPLTTITPGVPLEPGTAPLSEGAGGARGGRMYDPVLRGAHPAQQPHPTHVDLAVVVAPGAIQPWRVRGYEEAGIPILPVRARELDVAVGPLLASPGPCLRCIHLHLLDEDPRWPALATQLAAQTNPGIDPVVVELAACLASHQAIALADGRPAAVIGTSLHVDGIHPVPRFQQWDPHPSCGCLLPHLAA